MQQGDPPEQGQRRPTAALACVGRRQRSKLPRGLHDLSRELSQGLNASTLVCRTPVGSVLDQSARTPRCSAPHGKSHGTWPPLWLAFPHFDVSPLLSALMSILPSLCVRAKLRPDLLRVIAVSKLASSLSVLRPCRSRFARIKTRTSGAGKLIVQPRWRCALPFPAPERNSAVIPDVILNKLSDLPWWRRG